MPTLSKIIIIAAFWLLVVQCRYGEQPEVELEDDDVPDEEGYYYENDQQEASTGAYDDRGHAEEDRGHPKEYEEETYPPVHEPTQPVNQVSSWAVSTTEAKEQNCEYDGQILPIISREGSPVCYQFRVCKIIEGDLQDITVSCPFGLEWKQGTYECQLQSEKCRVQRLDDHTPTWLKYLLACPSTASLSFAEQSEIHRFQYYRLMNSSEAKQRDRHADFLTPIILEAGIFRHAADDCNSYFRCNYQEKSPFVHILNSAIYQRCDDGKIFNQDWNMCMKRDQFVPYGNYRYTHPDPNQRAICGGS